MKSIILVALALAAVAVAAPAEPTEPAQIVEQNFEKQPEGDYKYGYKTSTGIERSEEGTVKETVDEDNKPHLVVVVRGKYVYFDENGEPISVTYEADENGYRAEGKSIPKVEEAARQ